MHEYSYTFVFQIRSNKNKKLGVQSDTIVEFYKLQSVVVLVLIIKTMMNIFLTIIVVLTFAFVFNAFKVLPAAPGSTSKHYLFGNPEPSKDAAPAKKDGGLFG